MLKNMRILIFVSGSIAIYKTLELIRILRKNNALVRVVATKNALKFINPITFEALSNTPLLSDNNEVWFDSIESSLLESSLLDSQNALKKNHIGYAKWAQIALFAPISANCINKLANGIADNIYLSTALALRNIPRLLAPAANTFMLDNIITQENLVKLKQNGYKIIESRSDILACGDKGNGAMADINEIIFAINKEIYNFYPMPIIFNEKLDNLESLDSKSLSQFWCNKNVIVTAGGSSEDIDDIRCITNHSSGIQGANLALALYYLGAKVRFITSKIPFLLPRNIEIISVKTSKDYNDAINKVIDSMKSKSEKIFLFMVAAISDYIPQKVNGKIKKQDTGEILELKLSKNKDILSSLDSKKLVKIAFKAECDSKNAKNNAKKLLDSKGCAAVCLNIINKKNKAFGETQNEIYFIAKSPAIDSKKPNFLEIKLIDEKFNISLQILTLLKNITYE